MAARRTAKRTVPWRWVFAGAVALGLIAVWCLNSNIHSRGYWCCETCGQYERRLAVLDVPVRRTRLEPDPTGKLAAYQRWWNDEIHVDHEHLWMRIGSYRIGYSLRATLGHQELYLLQLCDPAAPTPSFRAVALALATAAESERPELISGLKEVLGRNWEQPPIDPEARIAALRERSPAWAAALSAQPTADDE